MEKTEITEAPDIKQYYIDLWNSRKKTGMNHDKESWDRRAYDWIKELTEDEDRKQRSAMRVKKTGEFLRAHGLLGPEDEVIDIGCGPGRFVAEFAKTAKHATGTDISEKMCEFGLEHAHSQGLDNVSFVQCDFKAADPAEMGWNKKFDLVFSSITPALSTYESFRKAESMSRAFVFQSNFVRTTDPLGDEVLEEVFDEQFLAPKRSISGFTALFNILCLEGCLPEVTFYREISDEILDIDDELVSRLLKNTVNIEPDEKIRDQIKKALEKRAGADGKITRHMEWIYGWILWDVREKQ